METTYPINQTQPDLLDGFGVRLVTASSGQRLANLFIDLFSFYGVMIVLGVFYRPFLVLILTPLLPAIFFALYMSFVELIFKGRTLGKLITGTRAVQEDGAPITASEAFAPMKPTPSAAPSAARPTWRFPLISARMVAMFMMFPFGFVFPGRSR